MQTDHQDKQAISESRLAESRLSESWKNDSHRKYLLSILGIVFVLGTTALWFVVKNIHFSIKKNDHVLVVKGLAEQEAMADIGIWGIRLQAYGSSLKMATQTIDKDTHLVKEYLIANGIQESEISTGNFYTYRESLDHPMMQRSESLGVSADFSAPQARNKTQDNRPYVVNLSLSINTHNIEFMNRISDHIFGLLSKGVSLASTDQPRFIFNNINDIKASLLQEAIANAKKTADEFARNADVHIGRILQANQGVISILSKNMDSGYQESISPEKIIRMIVTIDYEIT